MFIRPLIEIERQEIDRYIQEKKIDFVVDSSNLRRDYLRNKIRFSIIPIMKEVNPNIIETLSRTAAIFREEERHFDIIVVKTLMRLISRKSDSRIELFLFPLEAMDKVILRRVLRRAIDETKGLRRINFIHVEDIIDLIKTGKAGDRLYLPKGIRVIKDYSTLIFTTESPVKLDAYTLEVPGEIRLKEAEVAIKASIIESQESEIKDTLAFFDAEKLSFPLVVRSRKSGDFFYPFGFGKRKKLQELFVVEKVPRDERDRIPLIICEDEIIWIALHRQYDSFKIRDVAKKVLRLEVKKLKS